MLRQRALHDLEERALHEAEREQRERQGGECDRAPRRACGLRGFGAARCRHEQRGAAIGSREREQRAFHAERRQQHEARRERAGRRADRVPQCDDAGRAHRPAELPLDGVRDEREGGAGQQRHRQHQEHGERREHGQRRALAKLLSREQIEAVVRGHDHEAAECRDVRQPPVAVLVAVRELARCEAAETDAREHDRQHHGEREPGARVCEQQEAEPHDLEREHDRARQQRDPR